MRVVAATAFALALCALASGANASLADDFSAFKTKYGRKYGSDDEEARRFRIFADNMERAAAFASANPHASFGVNEFADMSSVEFKTRHNGQEYYKKAIEESRDVPKKVMSPKAVQAAAGQKVDWRQHGAVTHVKNQGQCGSCWSFSTTGGIEGQWFLAGNKLVSLSEQEFVSCDTNDNGCKGGLMDNAYKWILQTHNGTLVTEKSYPYVSGGGDVPSCNMNDRTPAAQIDGYEMLAHNEDQMAAWVLEHGPLSIAVDAGSWQTYTGGVMTNCRGLAIDHGVLIVGFDDSYNPPYWIVKNSWGPIWGEQGYIRVQKGNDQCIITAYPTSAKVAVAGPTPNPGPTSMPVPTPPPGTQPAPEPFPKGWIDLLTPPYRDAPEIALAISCLANNSCYIPGGQNGAGFGVFNFNGERNGYFRHVALANESGMTMFMAAAVGGSPDEPHGAVGGMDFGSTPEYFTGKFRLGAAVSIPFVVTQSMSADRATGMNVLFADGFDGNENQMWFSTNGGRTYTTKNINSPLSYKNCTFPNSQVVASQKVWYVVSGSNPAPPPNPNPPPPPFAQGSTGQPTASQCRRNVGFEALLDGDVTVLHRRSQFHAIVRDNADGKIKHSFVNIPKYIRAQKEHPLTEIGCPFVAAIQKTTDSGSTWTTVFEKAHEGFMMDFIDCASETHCVAVGGGANATHNPGSRVFTTTDGGASWKQTMWKPFTSEMATFIDAVQFVPGSSTDVWLAGNVQTANGGGYAEFWFSGDGGQTWHMKQRLNFIMAVTDMSFAPDGTGFATGLTVFKDTTVMRYTPDGPPQTPAPMYSGNFTQTVCPESGTCGGECKTSSFPQKTCLNLTNGFSAEVECDMQDNILIQRVYPLDRVCWGPAEAQLIPLDQCLVGNPGTIKFNCGAPSQDAEVDSVFHPVQGKPVLADEKRH